MRHILFHSRVGPLGLAIACVALGPYVAGGCTGAVGTQDLDDKPDAIGGGSGSGDAGPGGPPAAPGPPAACASISKRLWKLTPDQYEATVAALIPEAPRDLNLGAAQTATLARASGFAPEAARLEISAPHAEALLSSADAAVTNAVRDPSKLNACLATSGGRSDLGCVRSFVETFGKKAFRRPLDQDEVSDYVAFFESEAKQGGADSALDQLLHAFLMSPHFLFRTELGSPGGAGGRLTSYEVASALSYLFLDGPPDDELMQAADNDELNAPARLEAQVRRLVATRDAARGLRKFFSLAYGFASVRSAAKNEETFPDWSSAVADDLVRESESFVDDVLWSDAPTLTTLLTANHSMLNERLASFYGVAGPKGDAFVRTVFPAGQRSGLLTQGSLLARMAGEKRSDIVHRGKFVRTNLLCYPLPQPPPNVNASTPEDLTIPQREWLDRAHSSRSDCAGCHRLMDPLGYPLESFDGVGKWRTIDAGKPIDTSGLIADTSDGDIPVANVSDLGQALAKLKDVQRCFVKSLTSYAKGLVARDLEECQISKGVEAFEANDGNIIEAVVAIVKDPAFFTRTE